jgi:hypothetical protein
MLPKHSDKILFIIGLGVLGGSYYQFGRIDPEAQAGATVRITTPREYEVRTFAAPKIEQVRWADARPQPAGPLWIYDLFTPPLIFLDPSTGTLSPEPPRLTLDPQVAARVEFPFVLVDITRDLYRIQLSGFFGEAPDYRVSLEDREAGILIGRPGTVFERSDVELRSFNVERRTIDQGGTPIVEEVATAVIFDRRTQEEIALSLPGEPRYLPTPKAEFRTRDEVPIDFVLRAGEQRKIGDFTYTLRELTFDPKLAVVVREKSGDLPELRREMAPTPREKLPVERPPSIQGGAPSAAPFARPGSRQQMIENNSDESENMSPFQRRPAPRR